MKNKLLCVTVIFALLLSVFSFVVSADSTKTNNTSIAVPRGYKYVTPSTIDENLQLIEEINFSRQDFEKYLLENKIILFAYNSDNKNEIIVKLDAGVWNSEFDINLLDEESLAKMATTLTTGLDYEKVTLGEYVFIRTKVNGNDNGGAFNVIRYVTIQKGNLISVEFMFDGEFKTANSEFSENVMGTFYTQKGTDSNNRIKGVANDVAVKCLIIFAVLAGVCVAVYVVVTLVIDLRKKRNTSDVAPYVKIKRRKF